MPTIINLYPPVIDTYMPAAVTNNPMRVYFSLSNFNSFTEIKYAQVTVVRQNTNKTVLDKTKYPCQIKLTTVTLDDTRTTDDKYYIELAWSDIHVNVDEFYKVQIRLTSTDASTISLATPQQIDSWIQTNANYTSEWSRACLIKYIPQPTLTITSYNIVQGQIVWSMANNELYGALTFASETKEYLSNYRVMLYDSTNDTLLTDSGILYTDKNSNDKNNFLYTSNYAFEKNHSYYFKVDYQTNSLYNGTATQSFTVIAETGTDAGFTITVNKNDDDGVINVQISRVALSGYNGTIIIRRSSSNDNFTTWEDMYKQKINNATSTPISWDDKTIESGVWYKYALQQLDDNVTRGYFKQETGEHMLVLDDMYLTDGIKQLKIKFNPQVSSFKQVISEAKIETIGSPYPFFRRNAAINYAQFPISGLISCQMDENQKFITKVDLYGGQTMLNKYESYVEPAERGVPGIPDSITRPTPTPPFNPGNVGNEPWQTTPNNDFVWEKKFRDAVIKFLQDGKVKLFRSATEGNYLVRITDVNFTPNQQLGRMVWTFSATANEIAENTIDNYKKYNIL